MSDRRLLFVCVPWHALQYPSLALGILGSIVQTKCPGWQVQTRFANLEWAQFLSSATAGRIGHEQYSQIGEEKQRSSPGEWVFSSALHEVPEWRVEEYRQTFVHNDALFDLALEAHRMAPLFIDELADQICNDPPDLLGLSSTFAQNVACLALARAIKKRCADIQIVIGGANTDGVMGPSLHREFPQLDYVVSGEGEDSIVQLLSAISGEMEFSEVQNLSWRDASGQSIANAQVSTTDISKMPPPDFDAYFKQVAEYPVAESVEPTLVLETSRGCWWGAKHHCTFCGLNGSTMAYRKKSPETIIREITGLVDRHQALDIIMADNIIAMESFSDLLPVLKEMDLDVRLQFEIKANLTAEQVTLLRDSKVIHVQPGIESLSSHVLKLMKKGVTGAQNVYSLRELEANNITVSWNLLAGFPGERESDYEQMIRSFEDLCHLAPPIGVMRIMIQRFSPFFDKPWLGFEEKYPAKSYEVIYDRPQHVLNEMVYMFEANSAGISHDLIDRMEASVEQWKKRYWSGPALNHSVQGERILISDSRPNRPSEPYWLAVGLESAVFLELDKPSRLTGLMRRLKDQNLEIERIDLEGVLTHLISLGLVFAEDGWFLRLSIGEQPHRIRQVHCVTKVAQSEELNLMPLHA